MEKITPRVDIAFKKIFGVEENKDLLMLLINSIVSEEDQVVEVTLLRIATVITSYYCIKSDHHLYAFGSTKKLDGHEYTCAFL